MDSRRVQFLLLTLLVIHSSAEKCKPSTCFTSNDNAVYKPTAGQQYTYDFESSATTQLVNKESVETSVAIRGQAVITAQDNCGYTLALQNVIASGADNSKQQIKDFATHPVQFTLAGDELSAEICADIADNVFSLNVKRGIISAFQNGAKSKTELDIFGKCPVTSTSSTNGAVTTITRQRDLNKCAYREKLINGMMQSVVTEASDIKTSPLLDGSVESEAKFQNGVLQSTEIRESYNYVPFSTDQHGAKAKVTTKMTLKKTADGSANPPKNGVQRSLLFGNANENLASQKVKDSIKAAFDKTLREFTDQEGKITSSAAPAFAELVRLMRLAKKGDLAVSYQTMKSGTLSPLQSGNKALSRSIFLDALFRVGTGESVGALVALSQKEFDEREKHLMYLSFNLVTSPTKESIAELAKLFKDNLPKEAYLSIGSIVSKYCRDRGCDANEVKPIADKFVAKIPKDCTTKNRKDEEHLVSVLKGIRNSQTILNSALNNIIACASGQKPTRVRVAAFQAFTANPCNKKLQQAAISVMKNREEDSEVRIEAYLTAMECPNGNFANEVVALLDSEKINQVGTFINSHIDSIKASTDPKREMARHHFRNVRTSKKFPFDPRRYSFNREISYAIDSLGLGSAVDTSVIYSQRSFLPRSVKINATGNLFGNAFNFFELSARQENLESVIEHYFGPRGFFNRLSKQELYDEFMKEFSTNTRNKRALPQDLAQFDKSVKLSSEYNREPDVDLSVKVFGTELYFLSMSHNIPSTPSELLKLLAKESQKGLDALKNFNYNFENHALWLDSEMVYPTALGLPFKLSATGASAVKVDLSGSIDVKAILENPLDSRAELNFNPSANFFVAGTIGFNAYAFESGIEVSGTIFTNTGANTTIELQGGKNFIVKTIPTHKSQYVIDLKHQISTVTQESGREAVKVQVPFKGSDNSQEVCFDQVEFLIGAAICIEMQMTPASNPNEHAQWPLHGSSHVGIKLETADSITFRAELDFSDPEQPSLNFYHDTPDDGKPRQTTFKLLSSIKPTHYFGGFALSVPWLGQTFEVDGKVGFVNEDAEKKIYADGKYQGQKHEYAIGFTRKGGNIVPILKLNTDFSYISGNIIEKKTPQGISYELKQIKFGQDNYQTTLDGSIDITDNSKLSAKMRVDVAGKEVNFDGSIGYQPGSLNTELTMKSNSFPNANGNAKYNLNFADKSFSNDVLIVWDKNQNDKLSRVEISQSADWSSDNCKIKNEISVGRWNADAKFNGEFGKKIINLDSSLQYQKSSAEFKVENKYSQKNPHDYETSIYAAANKKSIKIDMSRDIEGDSSKIKNKIELSTGLKVELNGKVSHKCQYRDADISIQAIFVPGPKKDQTKVTFMLKNTQKGHEASAKVINGKTEVANGESKLTYGPDMKGIVKANIKDIANIEGSLEANRGKGKGDLTAALKDKKVRAETTFTFQKPTFDFSADFYYDYEKDNSKKVSFSTQNKLDQQSIDSKNFVEIFSERYAMNVGASNEGKYPNGKQKVNVEIELPTGRKFSVNGDRELSIQDGKGQGKTHFTATDELPNRQQRQLIVDANVNNLNIKQSFFDFAGSLKYKNYDNKDIKLVLALKNLAKGHFSTANGNLQVEGAYMPHTMTASIRLDEYCSDHAIYSFNGKYGNLGDVDVSGKFYVANKDRPHSHEFTGTLNLPNTKLQRLILNSKGEASEPADANGVYGVKYTGLVDYTGNQIQIETEVNFSKSKGTGKVELKLPNQKPFSGDFKFNCNHKDSGDLALNLNYGDGKKIATTLKGQMPDDKHLIFGATLQGDLQKLSELTFNLDAKQNEDNNLVAKINGKVDGQPYQMDYEHRVSQQEPKISVVWNCPKGTSKLLAEAQIASMLKGKGSLTVENLREFNLDTNVDADLTSLENFYLRGDINCPLININKIAYDIHSKNAGGRTGIEYKITRDGAQVLSGTSDFTTKTEQGRTVIEGKSTLKLTDGKSDDVTFKIIRNVYDRERDGEAGFGGAVTVNVGPRQYSSELKLTDKEFHSKYSGCEKKGSCTNFEARSALEQAALEGFRHNLEVLVDMRQVGLPHQYNMKAETYRDGFNFKHVMDSSLFTSNANNPEYRYSVYVDQKKAEASLKMPKREVAVEAKYSYPEKKLYGKYQGNVAFFIDKNKPQMKSELGFDGDVTHSSNVMKAVGKVTFTHPRVKTLGINGEFSLDADQMAMNSNIEFDVFTNPMDKIVFSGKFGNSDTSGKGFNITNDVEIFSKGLDWKLKLHEHTGLSFEQRLVTYSSEVTLPVDEWRFGVHAFASEKNFEVIGVVFNEEVLKANAVYDLDKHDLTIESTLKYLAADPLTTKSIINGLTSGTFKMNKGSLLDVDGGFGIGKDIHLKVIGSGKEIFNGNVALDTAHFLKTSYNVDDAAVKAFSTALQNELSKDLDAANAEVKNKFEKIKTYREQKQERILKALPDFKTFTQEYMREINLMIEELKSDPNIQKFFEVIGPVIEIISKYFEDMVIIVTQQTEAIQEVLTKIYDDFMTGFNEKILPELKNLYEKTQELLKTLIDNATKAATAAFERAAKALKEYESDFNRISQSFKDITGGIMETLTQYYEEIIRELKKIYQQFKEQFQNLPGLNFLKEKYQEYFGSFSPLNTIAVVIDELLSTIKEFVPEKAKPFFDKASDYITKKMAGESVNDAAFLKEIFELFKEAVEVIRREIYEKLNVESSSVPFSFNALKRLPPFITNIRFSALSQLTSEPIVSIKDILYLYRPYAFNPAEALPPFTMHGEIADGSHFFTFDGRHMTFAGGCSYILARDFSEGNFSIIASMNSGKMKSITVHDKNGWIEVNSETGLKFKDKDSEFPVHDKTLHAWRNFNTFSILTQFGASVECSTDLKLCHVEVSGFYSGKTRGLMGNGNGEPYDDFLLPDGKITESTTDLGEAYKTQKACTAPSTSGDAHPKSYSNEFCSQYFGRGESSLRVGFLFVNPTSYREACEHATNGAANPQHEACMIASIYVSRCRQEFIPVSIPKACSQCTVGKQKVDVGDEVSVKVPQKEADIVVVFDGALEKGLTVVTEIMNELRKDLKAQGITDVNVIALGYSDKDRYYSIYTTKGKLDFKGKFENLKGTGVAEDEVVVTGVNEIDEFVDELKKGAKQYKEDSSTSPDARAFQKALQYPFRATASKTILAVRSNGIPFSINPSKLATANLVSALTSKRGITVHTLMPVEITEPVDKAKNIVGFNKNVALLINEKKRPNMGSVEVAQKMKYKDDMGVDITKEHGYVFNLNAYTTDKKKFVGVVSYVLADTIGRTEVTSECVCELSGGIYPITKCEEKSRQFLAPKKSPARG